MTAAELAASVCESLDGEYDDSRNVWTDAHTVDSGDHLGIVMVTAHGYGPDRLFRVTVEDVTT